MKHFLMTTVVAMVMTACGGKSTTTNPTTSDMTTNDTTGTIVNIETSMGNISVRLFNDTPAHRDNFLKLVNDGYYDGTLFHRVIKDFMIQGGDPDSRTAAPGQMLGTGGPSYTLPAEIVYPAHFHKRGMLAAARQGDQVNPERRSSGSQFYIVTGQVYNDSTLNQLDKSLKVQRINEVFQRLRGEKRDQIMALSRSGDRAALDRLRDEMVAQAEAEAEAVPGLTAAQRQAYTTVGGTPHLDGQYTVFGEVIDGMDVVEAIQSVETGNADRPIEDVKIVKATVTR